MTNRQEETNVLNRCLLRLSKLGSRMFRNRTAQGWVGRAERIAVPKTVKLSIGDVVIRGAAPLHAGLCIGSSDTIGWTPVVVTEDMVGRRVAVFTAIEVKHETDTSIDQERFIEAVQEAGGIAGVAHSPDEAANLIKSYLTAAR